MMIRPFARLCGLAVLSVSLSQCSSFNEPDGPPDVINPTVEQMDALDRQWGLEKRVSKGSGKRYFNAPPPDVTDSSSDSKPASSGNTESKAADSSAAPAEKPASNNGAVDPAVIKDLQ